MRRWQKSLLRLTGLVIGSATVWGLLVLFESALIFFPSVYPAGFWDTDAVARDGGCTVTDCFFESDDGLQLHGWWIEEGDSSPLEDKPVILFFHGNAGNLSDRAGFVIDLSRLGFNVLIIDYRGYGRSGGRASEQGIYRDAYAAWRFLLDGKGVSEDRIVLLGKSLGGAVAIDLATRVKPAALVVQSSFTSVPDMAMRHYPFIPRFLIRTEMNNLAKLDRVGCPVMIIHSTGDEVAPFEMGQRLFDAASGPKTFFEVQGAGHNETISVGGRAYFDAVENFIRDHVEKTD